MKDPPEIRKQDLRILSIEDSAQDAELNLRELRRAGYILEATVIQSEAELVQQLERPYDVILSDYGLPGWTGMQAFDFLRRRPGGCPAPFILVTGSLGEETAVECLKQGISDFVLKHRLSRLPVAVQRAMDEVALQRHREMALEQLQRAHEQLEVRVQQRTHELSELNASLRDEVIRRKLAEVAARESEQRFRTLAEAIPEIVWTAQPDGVIDYCNQRWFDYSGLDLEQTASLAWKKAVHPDDAQRSLRRWQHSLTSGEVYEAELRLRSASDGAYRWHLSRALPLRDAAGNIVKWFGSSTDIHDQKLAQQAQAQLLAMRDDLVSNVSHSLRTPLASLRGFSELMLSRDFPQEKRREFLGIIHGESQRLTQLINRFLDLQRMEAGRELLSSESLDLLKLISERAALFAEDGKHRLRLEIPAHLPRIRGDAERLHEVLNNLISNALKYSPYGGDVILGARAETDEVVVWVADHGLGLPPEAMAHLFSKFYRVETAERRGIAGTGLGLAMVKQIVELHHGRVWAESALGEGSTFFVALPREQQEAPKPDGRGQGPRVAVQLRSLLIVEDDQAFARLLCQHFTAEGYKVAHTCFAEQALEMCRGERPQLLLLDIHLAGVMDGWDLLLALKQDAGLQQVPVIVMVGSDPNVHGLAMEGADYVLKSATTEELAQAVRRQLPELEGRHILVADDEPVFRALLAAYLRSQRAVVEEAVNGTEAMRALSARIPDLLVLDLLMPGFDGFEILRRLRHDRRAVHLRTLIVTAKNLLPAEKEYLERRLADLVGKSEADLGYFSQVVERTLKGANKGTGVEPELSFSAAQG